MDCIEHFVLECKKTKDWFIELGENKDIIIERIWDKDLENSKGKVLKKVWKERDKKIKRRRVMREREGEVSILERDLD